MRKFTFIFMVQERIIKFLKYKGITKYKFYKDTGLSNGFLDKSGSIGVDKCEIIYSVYPELNFEWLIIGRGSMLKSENIVKNKEIAQPENVNNNLLTESLLHTIEVQKKLIEKLEVEISILKEKNKG